MCETAQTSTLWITRAGDFTSQSVIDTTLIWYSLQSASGHIHVGLAMEGVSQHGMHQLCTHNQTLVCVLELQTA